MSNSRARENAKFPDALRAIAIFAVVVAHSGPSDKLLLHFGISANSYISRFLSFGGYGVELFFFLSGFLLINLYFEKFSLSKYVKARMGRIYPLWAAFLLIAILQHYLFGLGPWHGVVIPPVSGLYQEWQIIVLTLTFTLWVSYALWDVVIPGGWSIQSEVAHYIIFPILRKMKLWKSFLIILAIQLIGIFCASVEGQNLGPFTNFVKSWNILHFSTTVTYFYFGILFGHLFDLDLRPKLIESRHRIYMYLILLSVSNLFIPIPFGNQIQAEMFVLISVFLTFRLKNHLNLRFFGLLARYSYCIYFLHFQYIWMISRLLTKVDSQININYLELLAFMLFSTFFVSIVISIFSYRYFEKPILDRVRKSGFPKVSGA
ncbi:COG1835 Predicted acyltransferases [Candidatus Nanopelagicaceae bacterium]